MATPLPPNECELTLREIATATGGRLVDGDGAATVRGVCSDTRLLKPGALFVALRGKSDGHQYLGTAAALGAAAALTEREHVCGLPRIEVDDTLVALGRLAHFHLERVRARTGLPVIAIGGAVGKTSSKELTAALARARYGPVLATAGNLNNLIGVPLTLLALQEGHRAAVIECGTNAPGEICRLGEIVQPDVALVLNAEIEHTEGLGSLEGIADEEAALFAAARRAVVTHCEDALLVARLPSARRVVLFGTDSAADVRLLARAGKPDGLQHLRLGVSGRITACGRPAELGLALQLLGPAAALNAAAAVAALAACAPLAETEFARMREALAAVAPIEGRLELKSVRNLRVLDDTYNASPSSVRAALHTARELAQRSGARMLVVLGDMLELGELSQAMHETAIADAIAASPSALILTGGEMKRALEAIEVPADLVLHVAGDSREAAAITASLAAGGDVVLVKGSRGMRMERVIEALA